MPDEAIPEKREGLSPEWQEIRDFSVILRPLEGEMFVQKEGDPKSRGTTKRAIGMGSQMKVTYLPENRKGESNGYTTSPVAKIFQGSNGTFICETSSKSRSKYVVEGATLKSLEEKKLDFDEGQNTQQPEQKEAPKAPTFLDRIRSLFRRG